MPRKAKDFKFLSIKLDRNTHERLEHYCEIEGRTKTVVVERLLKDFLDRYDQLNPEHKSDLHID